MPRNNEHAFPEATISGPPQWVWPVRGSATAIPPALIGYCTPRDLAQWSGPRLDFADVVTHPSQMCPSTTEPFIEG